MTDLGRLSIAVRKADKLKRLVSVEILILADRVKICPVCKGEGGHYTLPPSGSTSIVGFYKTCHGCGGMGWV